MLDAVATTGFNPAPSENPSRNRKTDGGNVNAKAPGHLHRTYVRNVNAN